ncbi:MAG: NapC/NirT family cytochrome c [Clostridiales bacterium]|nr:NapC/NirT family cytochrome c [Clostridiales bacterium]
MNGFTDPALRPRYIIWTGSIVIGLAAFVIVALGVTSTNWFCAEGCHKVQADTIISFERSAHSNLQCMACHMKVDADPVYFVLHKAEALGELYLTATNKYSLPLNPDSHVALSAKYFPEKQCTQCHDLEKRPVTPSPGIIIDHAIHSEKDIHCTVCHNRVAHREDFELTLTDPNTGEPNRKHDDFMEMTACFRCHTITGESPSGIAAPGACEACHTPDFDLMPANHKEEGFYTPFGDSSGHARLANEDLARRQALEATKAAEGTPTVEPKEGGLDLVPVAEVGYCSTCHDEQRFCIDCHGIAMPHPADFAENHTEDGKERPDVCQTCHATAPGTNFCNDCHHEGNDPSRSWLSQHTEPVRESGANACFECHAPTFCAVCHVRQGVPDPL